MSRLAILNAKILSTPGKKKPGKAATPLYDLIIENGKILDMQPNLFSEGLEENCIKIDAKGNLVLPGAIDLHVKAYTSLETISQRAIQSGVTSLVIIPTHNRPLDHVEALNSFFYEAQTFKGARLYPSAALTKSLAGEVFSEIGLLSQAGAAFLTQGDHSIKNSLFFLRLCQYIKKFKKPVFHMSLDPYLKDQGQVHASQYSDLLGLSGSLSLSEPLGIFRDTRISQHTKTALVHDRVSTKAGLKQIYASRQSSESLLFPQVSCALYNLFFNSFDLDQYNIHAKSCPPLREEEDRLALLSALKKGEVDYIVSGDSYIPDIGTLPFSETPFVTKALEQVWPTGLTLAQNQYFPFENYVQAITSSPADLLGLPQGRLSKGCPADIVILHPNKPVQSTDKESLFYKRCLQGMVLATLIEGHIVYQSPNFRENIQNQRL